MNDIELKSCLEFIRNAESLKNVLRSANTSNGRKESTAEHTWRLCLLALVFEKELGNIDFAKLLKICILHDLGEAINGDIPAVEQDGTDKSAHERNDLLTLLKPLPREKAESLLSLWDEYDKISSEEAKIAKALDKLETIIQHNQGQNEADFNYEFNLSYGQKYMQFHPLFLQIREMVDKDTKSNIK